MVGLAPTLDGIASTGSALTCVVEVTVTPPGLLAPHLATPPAVLPGDEPPAAASSREASPTTALAEAPAALLPARAKKKRGKRPKSFEGEMAATMMESHARVEQELLPSEQTQMETTCIWLTVDAALEAANAAALEQALAASAADASAEMNIVSALPNSAGGAATGGAEPADDSAAVGRQLSAATADGWVEVKQRRRGKRGGEAQASE